jgi:hypothetical protein
MAITIDEFVEDMKQQSTSRLLEVSATAKLSKRTWFFPKGQSEIMVIRGGAIEKAAITYITLQGITRPDITGNIDTFGYQMEVFPENPYCPMRRFNIEGINNGTSPIIL